MEDLVQRFKDSMVKTMLNVKEDKLDIHYMTSSQGSFTRREMANEIANETEVGKRQMESMLRLTVDLLERGKEKV